MLQYDMVAKRQVYKLLFLFHTVGASKSYQLISDPCGYSSMSKHGLIHFPSMEFVFTFLKAPKTE